MRPTTIHNLQSTFYTLAVPAAPPHCCSAVPPQHHALVRCPPTALCRGGCTVHRLIGTVRIVIVACLDQMEVPACWFCRALKTCLKVPVQRAEAPMPMSMPLRHNLCLRITTYEPVVICVITSCRRDAAAAGAVLAAQRVHAGRHALAVAVRSQRRPQVRIPAGPSTQQPSQSPKVRNVPRPAAVLLHQPQQQLETECGRLNCRVKIAYLI